MFLYVDISFIGKVYLAIMIAKRLFFALRLILL